MKIEKIEIEGPRIISLNLIEDHRGFFARQFCIDEFRSNYLDFNIEQINTSFCHKRGTMRGLHYQEVPHGEVKFIRCISGEILDFIVDMRVNSRTYLKSFSIILSSENRIGFYVPEGFAHGYMSLKDNSEVIYTSSKKYQPGFEKGINWNDPEIDLNLPFEPIFVSEKDSSHPYIQK